MDKPLNEEQLAKVNTQDLEYRWDKQLHLAHQKLSV